MQQVQFEKKRERERSSSRPYSRGKQRELIKAIRQVKSKGSNIDYWIGGKICKGCDASDIRTAEKKKFSL